MAKDNPETPTPKPSLSDTNARDNFISVALREIIAWQLREAKLNHDQAGVLAVRYANSTMAARVDTTVLKVVVAKGAVLPPVELGPPMIEQAVPGVHESVNPPKSIAEIIGEPAEELAEVK